MTKDDYKNSFAPALVWFKNKALRTATAAIDQLAIAAERGFWLPEDKSRSIRAALNKSTIAAGTARNHAGAFDGAKMDSPLYRIGFCMRFGLFENAAKIDFSSVSAPALTDRQLLAIERGIAYAKSFQAVAAAFERLDATRPEPVFTYLDASPTVTATLTGLGLEVKPQARVCKMKFEDFEIVVKGVKQIWRVGTLLWPEGTVHGASRYSHLNSQCEACGHGIKRDNWVPLILDNAAGVPHALWTGRDCCRTIFGIKVTGEVKLKE